MEKHYTPSGRPLGPLGEKRREQLLTAVETDVYNLPWRRVSIYSAAKEVGCSPATFYQYWPSLESAVSELIQRKVEAGEDLDRRLTAIMELWETED